MSKTPVNISVLKTIYEALIPYHHRAYSIISDVSHGKYSLGEIDMATLYEGASYTTSLKILFEEYFMQAKEAGVDKVFLPASEFKNVLTMTKAIEAMSRLPIGHSGIWDH